MTKKLMQFVLWMVGLFMLTHSCATEDSIPVTASFTVQVVNNDYSVPVKINVTNKSEGADAYDWTFEGGSVTNSTQKNPPEIVYTTKGTYKITLKISNKDGNSDEKTVEIQIDDAMQAAFDWQMQGSDISPVTLQMQDQSLGASQYLWEFEGGNPASSTQQNPTVVFTSAGNHLIKLTISNGKETYATQKTVAVKPAMTVDFDWSVDAADQDYEAPVLLQLNNQSANAFSYEWIVVGASPQTSTETNPTLNFLNAGTYTIQLKATNDKESKTIEKQVVIKPNANLYTFSNIKLGINTAHSTIGSFFSSSLGKVITKDEVNNANGAKIDFAYFGLNASFSFNQFVSPDEVQNTAFSAIPNAIHTKVINSQELVGTQLSSSGFNAIVTGSDFNGITITESSTGKTAFNNAVIPRIILFQTADGRKGAVKINGFISDGTASYILVDIKIQKIP